MRESKFGVGIFLGIVLGLVLGFVPLATHWRVKENQKGNAIDRARLLSELVIKLDKLESNGEALDVKMFKNPLMALLASELSTLRDFHDIDLSQFPDAVVQEGVAIADEYWAVPIQKRK